MLACALASTVKQVWESSDGTESSIDSVDYSAYDGASRVNRAIASSASGDAYYSAAKKRLGLLGITLASAQCFFLAGLYEMCCMRPAGAWVHYSQACSRLQVILSQDQSEERDRSPDFHVLERLYFSCNRTEL